jgi:hypothetical protein
MKIESYAVNMSSATAAVKSYSVKEESVVRIGGQIVPAALPVPNLSNGAAILALSPEAQPQLQLQPQPENAQPQSENWNRDGNGNAGVTGSMSPAAPAQYTSKDQMTIFLLQRLVEAITGKKYNFKTPEMFAAGAAQQPNLQLNLQPMAGGFQIAPLITRQAINIETQRTETYRESQRMSFDTAGIVNTSDGRQIRFDMSVTANYEFFSESAVTEIAAAESVSMRICDPLVINLGGALPEFTKDRYAFDITIDGVKDNIFMPTNGSGFLALDKDGNGAIDDGSELFGAMSGNGFAELSAYDNDGNGWIDEGDAAFEQLKIMFVDKDSGETTLVSLKESGVGAIFLGSTKNGYEIKGDNNELVGVVQRNGIFLNENGGAGSIYHIDLTY